MQKIVLDRRRIMNRVAKLLSSLLLFTYVVSGFASRSEAKTTAVKTMQISLSSSAFKQGEAIPKTYTADGANLSPPLQWSNLPNNAKSIALICDDPDAPTGTWTHWVIYNIPSSQSTLAEGMKAEATLANGVKQGVNSFHKTGYCGPSPPPGKPHHYFFRLYALDSFLKVDAGLDAAQLRHALQNHLVAQGELIGTYGR